MKFGKVGIWVALVAVSSGAHAACLQSEERTAPHLAFSGANEACQQHLNLLRTIGPELSLEEAEKKIANASGKVVLLGANTNSKDGSDLAKVLRGIASQHSDLDCFVFDLPSQEGVDLKQLKKGLPSRIKVYHFKYLPQDISSGEGQTEHNQKLADALGGKLKSCEKTLVITDTQFLTERYQDSKPLSEILKTKSTAVFSKASDPELQWTSCTQNPSSPNQIRAYGSATSRDLFNPDYDKPVTWSNFEVSIIAP